LRPKTPYCGTPAFAGCVHFARQTKQLKRSERKLYEQR
jgi:hypothetical protein